MNAHKANLINAVSLFFMSLWAYLGSPNPSVTTLIPLLFGVILLSLNNGILYGLKGQSRAALVLTFIVSISLLKPFSAAIDNQKTVAIFRTGIMLCTSILSLFFLLKTQKK